MKRAELERLKTEALYAKQREYAEDFPYVIGVDEVGRGCIAGPVSVGAVVLPHEPLILGIKDSKKLSPSRREKLSREIRTQAVSVAVAHISPQVIDKKGIMYALQRAMLKAIAQTGYAQKAPVIIDGNPLPALLQASFVVKGDDTIAAIAAASIVAKVARDRVMSHLDAASMGYGFSRNKGYGTPEHIQALKKMGPSRYHRLSFCGNFLKNT